MAEALPRIRRHVKIPVGVGFGIRDAHGNAGTLTQDCFTENYAAALEEVEVTFPSGRTAKEICPTEIAVPVWCAHMGTLVFHPWPVRRSAGDR